MSNMKAKPAPKRDAREALSVAKARLIRQYPLYAMIVLRLKTVEWPLERFAALGLPPTMATDGTQLIWCKEFVEALTPAELVGVLAHEALHVMNMHPFRRGYREPRQWNIACDHVVNHFVKAAGLSLPTGGLPGVADKAAEELYLHAPPQDGNGGSASSCGEIMDPSDASGRPLTGAEREAAEQQARVIVTQALAAAKKAGALPAGLDRLCEDALAPLLPWREILAQFLDQVARNDYSWQRPNRRYLQGGIVLPSLWSQVPGRVVIACDTSGSIDRALLQRFTSEALACLALYQQYGATSELDVWWCDTRLTKQVVSDASELKPQGGGGTDFAPVFGALTGEERAIIYLTDGECASFGEEPPCPVLWAVSGHARFQPPFGEVLRIHD